MELTPCQHALDSYAEIGISRDMPCVRIPLAAGGAVGTLHLEIPEGYDWLSSRAICYWGAASLPPRCGVPSNCEDEVLNAVSNAACC